MLSHIVLSFHRFILTLSQRSKLQEVVYFWSMTVLPPPPPPRSSSLPPARLVCLTSRHLLSAVPSSFPRGLCSTTGCCRPTPERDMGKFTNSAPACPGRQKVGSLIEIVFVKAHILSSFWFHHCIKLMSST